MEIVIRHDHYDDRLDHDTLSTILLCLPDKFKKKDVHALDININGGTVANPVLRAEPKYRKKFSNTLMGLLKRHGVENDFTGRVQMDLHYGRPLGVLKVIRKE